MFVIAFELIALLALIWCWYKLRDVNQQFQAKRLGWLVQISQTRLQIRNLNETLAGIDDGWRHWHKSRPLVQKIGFILFKKLVRIV